MFQAAIHPVFHVKVKKGKVKTIPVFHLIPCIAKMLKAKNRAGDGQNACEIAARMSWARARQFADMNPTQQMFAAGEARAHVEHLVLQGKVSRAIERGVVRYTALL